MTVTTQAIPVRRAVVRVETTSEQVVVTRQRAHQDQIDIDAATAVPVATEELLDGALGNGLVLTADELVVTTRTVPVEQVRLVTSWLTTHQQVQVELGHEELTRHVLPAAPPRQLPTP